MTRDGQLLKAAAAMQADLLSQGYNAVAADNFADGFYEGACYADKNAYANWRKCDDELPDDTDPVLLYIAEEDEKESWIGTGERDFFNDRWNVYGVAHHIKCNVVAWMPLLQPPKFD